MDTSNRNLCMIPGPVEFHEDVLQAMSTPALSHIDPGFIDSMGSCLEMFRKALNSTNKNTQPFILSGSGTLGWDVVASNIIEPEDKALVISTGIFGEKFAKCLKSYAANVEAVCSDPGNIVPLEVIDEYMAKDKYKLLTLTHVDTSTGVFMDVGKISSFIKKRYPETIICVDAVCSALCEEIKFDEANVDIVITASQKAIGVPPGLCLMLFSEAALEVINKRSSHVLGYYIDLKNWIPIMKSYESRKPSYFATPSVQLVCALEVALKMHLSNGIDNIVKRHEEASKWFKKEISNLGLKMIPIKPEYASRSMTAVYYPEKSDASTFLATVSRQGVTLAGGLHHAMAKEYFRVGHMGISVMDKERDYLSRTISAIKKAIPK